MEYVFEERIGDPHLFTGRKEELDYFLKWIDDIKKRKSKSTAILARRKMGKTAIMERLFNITFHKNDNVIPFYYEVKESKMWAVEFCEDFFLTFIYQYIAFKSRKSEYLNPVDKSNYDVVVSIAEKEGLDYLCGYIRSVEHAVASEKVNIVWEIVRQVPKTIAANRKEFIVQMIDEFQFLNAMIYWNKEMSENQLASTFVGGYLSTAESKIAPLLVSGSWVGWLVNLLTMQLPARFNYIYLKNLPQDEAVEMVFKYSDFFEVPVTDQTAYLISQMAEGSPFYISSIMCSLHKGKDLATVDGVLDTLEFETLNNQGIIKFTWMEYVNSALPRINEQNAKNIVLYLCKNRDRELTRKEILDDLKLNMTDAQLEEKLKALVKADIIMQGKTNFDYRGVGDNIFDKVFRGVYEKEIQEFDIKQIRKEYNETSQKLLAQFHQLQGKYNNQKGYFAEFAILKRLQLHAQKKNAEFKKRTRYLPADFDFCDYASVWRYDGSRVHGKTFNIDILARPQDPTHYSIIGEVKSRDTQKFSKAEVMELETKITAVKELENIERAVGFIFSRCGFTSEADTYCKTKGIACSEDDIWLGD